MLRSRRSPAHLPFSSRIARIALGLCALLAVGQLAVVPPAQAVAVVVAPVSLGTAGTYAVLAGTGVTNTGPTTLTGDLGLSPSGAITGFGGAGNGTVTGATHDKDVPAGTAQADRLTAYNEAATRPGAAPFAGDQIGQTFEAGLAAAWGQTSGYGACGWPCWRDAGSRTPRVTIDYATPRATVPSQRTNPSAGAGTTSGANRHAWRAPSYPCQRIGLLGDSPP